jgi:multidrug transporter EmrE-like cation transporter
VTWIALAIGVVLNAAANILIKAGVRDGSRPLLERVLHDPWYLMGMTSFGLALVAYSYALTRIPLTVGYPIMTGVGMGIVAVAGWWWFGEPLGMIKLLGMACVVVGVVLLVQAPAQG